MKLLAEAARVVRSSGFVHVIHWRCDPATPRGPSMEIRPHPEQIVNWAKEVSLFASPEGVLDLPPWHYGIRLQRPAI